MPAAIRSPPEHLSILQLNVRGRLANDPSVLLEVINAERYDILVFTETWLREDADAPELPGFTPVCNQPRNRRLQKGSARGGIAIYAADAMASAFTVISSSPQQHYALMRIDGAIGEREDLHLFACYLPPEGSPALRSKAAEMWEGLRDEVGATLRLGHVLLVGDLNARTGTSPDFPGSVSHPVDDEPFHPAGAPPVVSERHSRDHLARPNAWGRELLDLCCVTGMRIVNGRVQGDEEGQVTFVSLGQEGSSLIDYALASPDAMSLVQSLTVEPAPESDHSALHLLLRRAAVQVPPSTRPRRRRRCAPESPQPPLPPPPTLRGETQLAAWHSVIIEHSAALFLLSQEAELAESNEDIQAVGAAFDTIISSTQAMVLAAAPQAKPRRKGSHEQPPWWDGDLAKGRRRARQTARSDPTSHAARVARAEYQRLLRRKTRHYNRAEAIALTTLAQDNPARFWGKFKPAKKRSCPVPDDQMLGYFRELLGSEPSQQLGEDTPAVQSVAPPAADGSELNAPFTEASVRQGIKSLHGGKATVGVLKLDALSIAAPQLAFCLAAIFNACRRVGALPQPWALCGVTPIHKGGDASDPGNYRGIAVGSLLAKLYASMLNERLMEWTERHNLRARGQAGFRKDRRTTDQVFVLRTLIESARAAKQPLYACYVDFKKAYDTIDRDLLWVKLQRIGVHGEFLQAVRALYADVPMGLQLADGMSDTFSSLLGVKQGCPLSPTLFGIFIDDFQCELEAGAAGFGLPTLAGALIPALFYADDLALISCEVEGLQAQLDLLQSYSARWGLTVNVKKTKVVAYTTPQRKVPPPQLTYMSAPIEVLDSFTYLGVQLHSTHAFAAAGAARAQSARRAMLALQNRCADLHLSDPTLLLQLFDALVRPVMLYGVEAWGPGALSTDANMQGCELVQRKFLRSLLGVRAGTPNDVVLGELARFPVAHAAVLLTCRFWNRLVDMPAARLTKQAFLENVALAGRDSAPRARCWAAQVVSVLDFMQPIVDGVPQHIDPDVVGAVLQRRHFEAVNGSPLVKLQSWLNIRGPVNSASYTLPGYLQAVEPEAGRRALAQFRSGSHWLGVEAGRWIRPRLEREERLCKRCDLAAVDDEAHMIWACPKLIDIRIQHIDLFRDGAPQVERFLQQDASQLAAFLHKCYCKCGDLEDWSAAHP